MKPLLVGESNPYQDNAWDGALYALYPEPENSAGGRLCRLILRMSKRDYLRAFDRTNLCHGKWSLPVARDCARNLLAERCEADTVVLCGSKVCNAFGVAYEPFTITRGSHNDFGIFAKWDCGVQIVVLPHPSGLSRAWNEPRAVERARAALRTAGLIL